MINQKHKYEFRSDLQFLVIGEDRGMRLHCLETSLSQQRRLAFALL